jgi:hypothetical protein
MCAYRSSSLKGLNITPPEDLVEGQKNAWAEAQQQKALERKLQKEKEEEDKKRKTEGQSGRVEGGEQRAEQQSRGEILAQECSDGEEDLICRLSGGDWFS